MIARLAGRLASVRPGRPVRLPRRRTYPSFRPLQSGGDDSGFYRCFRLHRRRASGAAAPTPHDLPLNFDQCLLLGPHDLPAMDGDLRRDRADHHRTSARATAISPGAARTDAGLLTPAITRFPPVANARRLARYGLRRHVENGRSTSARVGMATRRGYPESYRHRPAVRSRRDALAGGRADPLSWPGHYARRSAWPSGCGTTSSTWKRLRHPRQTRAGPGWPTYHACLTWEAASYAHQPDALEPRFPPGTIPLRQLSS